jgi:PadR family transcriptional regulator AphA
VLIQYATGCILAAFQESVALSLRHVILAVLSQSPASGYDITREFDVVAGFFWKASHQQIYRELAAMAADGLVRFKAVVQDGKPDKKLYSITAAGRREFARWFAEPTPIPRASDPLMIKFFSGKVGGIAELRAQLALARAQHEAQLRVLEGVQREHYPEPIGEMPPWKVCIFLSLSLGLARERAWLDWAETSDRALGVIQKGK